MSSLPPVHPVILSFLFGVCVCAWAMLLVLVVLIQSILRHLFTSYTYFLFIQPLYIKNSVLARCINAFAHTKLGWWCLWSSWGNNVGNLGLEILNPVQVFIHLLSVYTWNFSCMFRFVPFLFDTRANL